MTAALDFALDLATLFVIVLGVFVLLGVVADVLVRINLRLHR